MPSKLLKVFANPFGQGTHCHDHLGRAHHRVQYEPDPVRGDPDLLFVGCRILATETKKADPKWRTKAEHDHSVEYATEPTTVAASAYYMRALAGWDLIPADPETHEYAFGSKDGFEDPIAKLKRMSEERKCVPALQPTEKVDLTKPRDREAEWAAFVAKAPAAAPELAKVTPKPAPSASAAKAGV